MKKLFLIAAVLFCFVLTANAQQVLTGSWYVDKDTPGYTLDKNVGDRTVDIEVVFTKPFKTKPEVALSVSLIDEVDPTQMRYQVSAKSVSRDGFTVQVKVWSETKLNALGGFWVAVEQ